MKTADPELMRAINRYHVIDAIRRHGPIARVEIAQRIDLSPATVSAITGGLIEEGVIHARHVSPGDAPASEGAARESLVRGRPRVLLDLNGRAFHVVGAKLSLHRIDIAVTDFRGDVLRTLAVPVRLARQPPEVIADLVEDGVRQCVIDAGLRMTMISGVGIGIPGLIDGIAGVSHWSQVLGPRPVPFAGLLRRRIGVPVLIENDANVVVVAEHWFGHARALSTFVVVTVENAVGMGLFIDGRLYRGAHGIGAEFGHVKIDPAGPLCRCGQRGCLDAYASDSGIVAAARAEGLIAAADDRAPREVIADITRRGEAGEPAIMALFARAGAVLGLGIANIVNVLNPPRIIVTGEGLRAGAMLSGPLLAAVDDHVLPTLREASEIVFQPWGEEMWARGAASLVLRQIYEAPWNSNAA